MRDAPNGTPADAGRAAAAAAVYGGGGRRGAAGGGVWEGGDGGGKIIAVGTPEELAEHPTSHTGKFLKEMLTKSNINNEVKLVKAS